MSLKQYSVTISVDESTLKQAYIEGHDISPDDCPDDIESMLSSELNWLSSSGISFSGNIAEIDLNESNSIFIEWSVDDVRSRAQQHGINLSNSDCIEILECVENNHDANLGISWDTIDNAIDLFN